MRAKRRHFLTHSALENLHPCTLRKFVKKVLKKITANKNLCMEDDKKYRKMVVINEPCISHNLNGQC